MRLTKIKLAGFKSFVDPTTIPVIGNLAAIVGPNGCGKSNVIDAVRWVMGESSAKKLRGGELADVIFNGSSARKPLGQASVELIFDNTQGVLGGEYANYTEISIRRLVTRDGQSNYFFNGTRCRRRDIKDVFLGTGLGPRSYSIIEQGMISRFIEAKPEDLRNFVEEAAGISKYKDRRRETENRIRHTRENLERLTDLRDELDKQLRHLQRQSEAAEKFKTLKAEERQLDAQLAALTWHKLNEEIQNDEHWIRECENQIEKDQAERQSIETQLEAKRQEQIEANEAFNQVQERFYNIGNEIARIEQTIKHHHERRQNLEDDYHQAQNELNDARGHLNADQSQIEELQQQLENLRPEYEQIKAESAEHQDLLLEKELAIENFQADWEAMLSELEQATRQADVEKTKIAQLEKQIHQVRSREQKLQEELDRLNSTDQSFDLNTQEMAIAEADEQVKHLDEALAQSQGSKREMADKLADSKKMLSQEEKALAQHEARLTSLQTLQKTMQGEDNEALSQWLTQHQIEDNKRLFQTIDVMPDWAHALETVLGDALQSILIDEHQVADMAHALIELETGSLNLSFVPQRVGQPQSKPSLIDKIQSELTPQIKSLLHGIYIAETVDDALAMLSELDVHESVVTKQGLWISQTWMRIKHKPTDETQSLLHREQEIKSLQQLIEGQTQALEQLKQSISDQEEALLEIDAQREHYQFERNQAFKQMTELKYTLQTQKDKLEHLTTRQREINQEQAETKAQVMQWQQECDAARSIIAESVEKMAELNDKRDELQMLKQTMKDALTEVRETVNSHKAREHEIALSVNQFETQLSSTRNNITRFESQIQNLEDRLHQIKRQQTQNDEPIEGLKQELDGYFEQRLEVEEHLNQARDNVAHIEQQIREQDAKSHALERNVSAQKERLDSKRMHWQAQVVRRETAQEKINQLECDVQAILQQIPEDADESVWAKRLQTIDNQIQRLGPINLAAIDEFAQLNERKVYLDSQDSDLNEALKTLENAIHKIDKETRHRFRETFERINQNFQELFPKLFGGGQAQMSLTSDDLLETGITVMARPPGKKNTTIHLLSGGEKALTAMSLVFSIFQLNPAPFCMLDEVDAPLDDYNVGRFCNLVKDMSKTVQFIYISHNKLALEMADQLQGVTMKEPGVSRIVTVDVEKAQSLAEA